MRRPSELEDNCRYGYNQTSTPQYISRTQKAGLLHVPLTRNPVFVKFRTRGGISDRIRAGFFRLLISTNAVLTPPSPTGASYVYSAGSLLDSRQKFLPLPLGRRIGTAWN
jgi:hypothetical protein